MQVPDPKEGFLLLLCVSLFKELDLFWKLSSLKVVVYEKQCMKKDLFWDSGMFPPFLCVLDTFHYFISLLMNFLKIF